MKYSRGLIAGSFDIIHPGYVRMFKESKEICEHLIVALQDDPTIDRPHKCKPVQDWEERREILSSIKYVDEILSYSTESELLQLLRSTDYDVRILGSDYTGKDYTGRELEKPAYFCNRKHDYSTTALKRKIAQSISASSKLLSQVAGKKSTYVFDIDGTIVTDTKSNYENAAPIQKAIEAVNFLYERGNKIVLMTARGATSGVDHTELTEQQMSKFGVRYHQLIMGKKPAADIFVDDKAANIHDVIDILAERGK